MGSPVSPIVANRYMKWLEKEAIATAPVNCQPRLWKRYVDDVLEIVKKGSAEQLTSHINQIDKTGNIKFTYEKEENQQNQVIKVDLDTEVKSAMTTFN